MAYTGNHRIDAVLLVAINDGDGTQCGRSYQERRQIAGYSRALWPWLLMVSEAAGHCGDKVSLAEAGEAARYLRQYYVGLIKEGA